MGRDSALKAIDNAVALRAAAADSHNAIRNLRARILVRFGDIDDTMAILSHLLQTSYEGGLFSPPLTPTLLRLDPDFDPLRDDQRFDKFCQEPAK